MKPLSEKGNMARIVMFLVALAALVVIILGAASLLGRAADSAGTALRPIWGSKRGNMVAPTTFQKIAYGALLVVLLGLTSGFLGGL